MKLNLGCWHRHIPGWVHVDLCDMPHIDYRSNIDDLSMFDNGTADIIYCSHAFEYFDREHSEVVLGEWRRVLKPGGILRLAVPDFDKLLQVYAKTGELQSILGPLYGRMNIETNEGSKTLYHRTTYTFDSLKELLCKNGFSGVNRYKWQNTVHKDYDDHSQAYYPHMDKENGLLISLNIECARYE